MVILRDHPNGETGEWPDKLILMSLHGPRQSSTRAERNRGNIQEWTDILNMGRHIKTNNKILLFLSTLQLLITNYSTIGSIYSYQSCSMDWLTNPRVGSGYVEFFQFLLG